MTHGRCGQWLLVGMIFIFSACATYYELNYEFNRNFESGELEAAERALLSNKKAFKRKTKFLYYANLGVVNHMLGEYEASNRQLEEAYIFGEDYRKDPLQVAASLVSNPNSVDYPGEDHEHLLILYYKAINYLKLNDYEAALVECRRLNNRLNALSDKYRSERKYDEDGFVQTLMGLIYEASGDYNNAFIAYRNAYRVYESDFKEFFGLGAPTQLKKDLIRAAYQSGFSNEVSFYEKEFGMTYEHQPSPNGELVFFWHNGLGPFKDEWSINFVTVGRKDGVVFVNDEYGFSFPFSVSSEEEKNNLTDLDIFRVTMPKYVERHPKYRSGSLTVGTSSFKLELAEDVNAIAFKSLEQRVVKDLSVSLLRAALKKTLEQSVEKENEGLGMVVGLINAATEKADTRNWQTIPHGIFYTRVPLADGENRVALSATDSNGRERALESFQFSGIQGKTHFHTYQSLDKAFGKP